MVHPPFIKMRLMMMLNAHANETQQCVSLPRQMRTTLPVYRASLPNKKEQMELAAPKHIITKPI